MSCKGDAIEIGYVMRLSIIYKYENNFNMSRNTLSRDSR